MNCHLPNPLPLHFESKSLVISLPLVVRKKICGTFKLNSSDCNEHACMQKETCVLQGSSDIHVRRLRQHEEQESAEVFCLCSYSAHRYSNIWMIISLSCQQHAVNQAAPFHHNLWAHLRKGASHLTCKEGCVARETWMRKWRGC